MHVLPLHRLAFVVLLAQCCLVACVESSGRCVPGRQIECKCRDGSEGIQLCSYDRAYGRCECSDGPSAWPDDTEAWLDGSVIWPDDTSSRYDSSVPPISSRFDASSPRLDAGSAAAPVVDDDEIASGTAKLIDVYAQGTNVWVVDADAVVLFALEGGEEMARWKAPRPITAAAFDGSHLVVLDGAKLTTLQAEDLSLVAEGLLIEACAAAVLLSENRLVCGPANDWDRVFYTYDALKGELLASSKPYTYHGIPMRAVPGLDAFVTVTLNLSPSDFYLYKLQADDSVAYVNESPYHGDFAATTVFAFDSDMPTHLINSDGLLLHFTLDCSGGFGSDAGAGACFGKDGALGTLTGSQRYVGLDNDGTQLVGLIDPRGNTFTSSSTAQAGLLLHTVDIPSRSITSQQVLGSIGGRVTVLRALLDEGAVVVATTGATSSSFDPGNGGYRVFRIALPAED